MNAFMITINTFNSSGLLFVCLLVLASCQKKADDSNVIINIDEEFDVLLLEELTPGDNALKLFVRTKEELECTNYDLNLSHSITQHSIVVSIDELELEGDCQSGNAYIDEDINLSNPSNGNYDIQLNLSLNSITNHGNLIVEEEQYRLNMETSHGVSTTINPLRRLPDGYVWGYFRLIDASATDVRSDFYDELESHTSPSALPKGHYGYFDIDIDNGTATLNPKLLNLSTTPPGSFIHQLTGDKSELLQMVATYQTDYAGQIQIALFTSEGEVL